jgi:hypothetical protein
VQQNRPSEGPFGAVYGQLHAGLVIRTLLSASVLPDTTGRLACELAQWVSSMDLSTRRFNSRSRSTEQHNSTSTSKALQIVPPTASGRSKNIESSMPQLKGSITAPTAVIPVHRTRSRGHFLTSHVCRRSCSPITWSSAAAGSEWPERHRNHSELLCTRHRPYHGTREPEARPHRSKWLHGCPAESVMLA